MDPLSLMSVFMGLAGGIGSLINLGNANQQAQQTTAEETQLLNEAQQQQEQQQAEPGLIAQRDAQEAQINDPLAKWNADDTLLTNVAQTAAAQPTETKTMQPAAQLGV